MTSNTELYTQDFYAWCLTTATLIRQGKWYDIDREALAEEIESVGRSQKRELESRIHALVMHLLKWCYQPAGRQWGHSWRSTIRTQRLELGLLLRDNPSLWPHVPQVIQERYPGARLHAGDETSLPLVTFPTTCPWTAAQLLDDEFWPAGETTA
jgi:Domain of unknown function DUF29